MPSSIMLSFVLVAATLASVQISMQELLAKQNDSFCLASALLLLPSAM